MKVNFEWAVLTLYNVFPHVLSLMCCCYPASNQRRADDKYDCGHVTPKRQCHVPKGAVALTTMRSSASEPCQETVLTCSTSRKAGVDSTGPGWKSKYTQSDDVDIGSGMLNLPWFDASSLCYSPLDPTILISHITSDS